MGLVAPVCVPGGWFRGTVETAAGRGSGGGGGLFGFGLVGALPARQWAHQENRGVGDAASGMRPRRLETARLKPHKPVTVNLLKPLLLNRKRLPVKPVL